MFLKNRGVNHASDIGATGRPLDRAPELKRAPFNKTGSYRQSQLRKILSLSSEISRQICNRYY